MYDANNPVYLMTIYSKASAENLTLKEEKQFSEAAKKLKTIFKKSR